MSVIEHILRYIERERELNYSRNIDDERFNTCFSSTKYFSSREGVAQGIQRREDRQRHSGRKDGYVLKTFIDLFFFHTMLNFNSTRRNR